MKILLASVLAATLVGCATIDSLQPGSGGSTFEVRGKSYDDIWKTAVRVMTRQLTVVESDRTSGQIKAESRVGLATWGEVVGVFIRPTTATADVYTVEVQSLKRSRAQLTGQDWAPSVIAGIKAELGM